MGSPRCETVKTTVNPWTMGGAREKRGRCENEGAYEVSQKSDNQKMTLCTECCGVFKKRNRGELRLYTFKEIA